MLILVLRYSLGIYLPKDVLKFATSGKIVNILNFRSYKFQNLPDVFRYMLDISKYILGMFQKTGILTMFEKRMPIRSLQCRFPCRF